MSCLYQSFLVGRGKIRYMGDLDVMREMSVSIEEIMSITDIGSSAKELMILGEYDTKIAAFNVVWTIHQ